MRTRFARFLQQRHGAVVVFLLVFMMISTLTRLALMVQSVWVLSWDLSLLAVLGWGLLFDLGAALWWALPLTLVLTILPARFFQGRVRRTLAQIALFVVLYALIFGAVAEWIFWDEFNVRFNFIAVDYLVYTTEVIANIF